jgi:hypothetical protein
VLIGFQNTVLSVGRPDFRVPLRHGWRSVHSNPNSGNSTKFIEKTEGYPAYIGGKERLRLTLRVHHHIQLSHTGGNEQSGNKIGCKLHELSGIVRKKNWILRALNLLNCRLETGGGRKIANPATSKKQSWQMLATCFSL